jgi:hypothetical protein
VWRTHPGGSRGTDHCPGAPSSALWAAGTCPARIKGTAWTSGMGLLPCMSQYSAGARAEPLAKAAGCAIPLSAMRADQQKTTS